MAQSGLNQFRLVLTNFRQLSALAVKGAVAAPAIAAWIKIGPPPATLLAVLTPVLELIALVWVFHFWFFSETKALNVRMKIAFVCFSIGLVSSLILVEQFTVFPGPGRDRVIEGFILRPDVKPILTATYTSEDALRDHEFDPMQVWTRESVTTLRVLLPFFWMLTFVAFSIFLAVFIIVQSQRKVADSNPRKKKRPRAQSNAAEKRGTRGIK
jgi:hypothetical protein